ncbi:MAG: hypothetical protein GC150_08515 [Rhizobiales bacterium]|nr:hypothetical protein [Hyphomicrobiales bacterium]
MFEAHGLEVSIAAAFATAAIYALARRALHRSDLPALLGSDATAMALAFLTVAAISANMSWLTWSIGDLIGDGFTSFVLAFAVHLGAFAVALATIRATRSGGPELTRARHGDGAVAAAGGPGSAPSREGLSAGTPTDRTTDGGGQPPRRKAA